MGVGVYSSDFKGTGGSFLVEGGLNTEEEYQQYLEDTPEDEAPDYETWLQDEVDTEISGLQEIIAEACERVGLETAPGNVFGGEDRAFLVLAQGNGFCVGMRGWEHDHVVGVWQEDADFGDNREGGALDIAKAYMVPPAQVLAVRDQLSIDLQEYVRLNVQEMYTCCYKTSGYTSAQYEDLSEDALAARLSALETSIQNARSYLDQAPGERVAGWSADDLKVMIELFHTDRYYSPVHVPVYDVEDEGLVWISADESLDHRHNENALQDVRPLPEGLEPPEVQEGAQLVAFPMSEALMDLCRAETIAREGNYRAGLCAPMELWEEVTGNELDLGVEDVPNDPAPSF